MAQKSVHVAPARNGWSVRVTGAARASKTWATQKEAIHAAREMLRKYGGGELYVYGNDGRIRERAA